MCNFTTISDGLKECVPKVILQLDEVCPSCILYKLIVGDIQWGNKGEGWGGRVPSQRLLTRKFLLIYREKRGKEKWKERKVTKWGEDLFFFAFRFWKPLKFVLGLLKWMGYSILYREKAFHARKKSGKMTLPPLKNIPLTPLVTSASLN